MKMRELRTHLSERNNRLFLVLATLLALAIFCTAYTVCNLQYAKAREEILDSQRSSMNAWISGTVEAINLWTRSLQAQTSRVTTSDLYLMFAQDVESIGGNLGETINRSDMGIGVNMPEGAAALAEQVPYMRNLLQDFIRFNGVSDARIVNGKGQTLLSAMVQPIPLDSNQIAVVRESLASGQFTFGPVHSAPVGLEITIADPLITESSMGTPPVASFVVSRGITTELAQFLARDKSDILIPHIVQNNGGRLEELQLHSTSPVALGGNSLDLDESGNMEFGKRTGINGKDSVYSASHTIGNLDWHILLETPAAEVDGRLHAQAWMIYGIGALISFGVVLLMALMWWVMIGREQRAVAQRFMSLYRVIKQQKQLLDSVNVSLEVGLLMAATDGTVQICNRAFAEITQREEAEIPGLNLAVLFETQAYGVLIEGIRKVVEKDEADSIEVALGEGDALRLFRVTLFPFEDEEVGAAKIEGAVAIFQDITQFRKNSERRQQQHVNTISALVRAVESVDPYLSGHSQRMALLGDLISAQLELSPKDRDTIHTAASLSQMFRLFVSRELLAKRGELSDEEHAEIMRAPEYAYNVLKDIDFGLPVAEAVYEMNERLDGGGYPRKLSGKDISLHARVLSVVNAFCAMASPRSYRASMPLEEILGRLREEDTFDQHVVSALEAVLKTPEGLQAAMSMNPENKQNSPA